MALQGREHELALLCEEAAAVLGVLLTRGLLERPLQRIDLISVLLDAVGHGLGAGQRRIAAGHETRARLRHAAHKLRALVGAALLVVHLLLVHFEANMLLGMVLGIGDGVGKGLLACGRTALVANAKRQVDTDIAVLGQEGEPRLPADDTHTGKQDLVFLGQAAERTRASDVDLLVGARHARDLVVERLGHLTLGQQGLGRAGGDAEAALATVVLDLDALVVQLDRLDRADVQAAVADILAACVMAQTGGGNHARAVLVVGRVVGGHVCRVRHDLVGHVAEWVLDGIPVVLDVDDVIEHVAFFCHASSPDSQAASSYCTRPRTLSARHTKRAPPERDPCA